MHQKMQVGGFPSHAQKKSQKKKRKKRKKAQKAQIFDPARIRKKTQKTQVAFPPPLHEDKRLIVVINQTSTGTKLVVK